MKNDVSVALIDIRMHPIDGIDLLVEIKKRSPSTHVIMISSFSHKRKMKDVAFNTAQSTIFQTFGDSETEDRALWSARLIKNLRSDRPQLADVLLRNSMFQIIFLSKSMTKNTDGRSLFMDRLDNEGIGMIWARHFPKRAENGSSKSLCLSLAMVIRCGPDS